MHEAGTFAQVIGDWSMSVEVDFFTSWSDVRDIWCATCRARFGLTAQSRFDNFDEYTKRQYNAKAPHITNPFGYDEQPRRFLDFDVLLKLRVLHQLSVWTFWNADRIRDKMPEKKESEQLQWVSCDFLAE
jgi:hypothetical protein